MKLVTGFSSRRPGFAPTSICLGFVVGNVVLGQVCFYPSVFPLSVLIPPMLHVHYSVVGEIDNGPFIGVNFKRQVLA
jgi:hypothetical protein